MSHFSEDVEYFLDPYCIRERSLKIFEAIQSGQTRWSYEEAALEECANFTLGIIRHKYPELRIPFHSRRGHLRSGGRDRIAEMFAVVTDPKERLCAEFDLIITSVFLDAGAGPKWTYTGKDSLKYSRSEGLAVASFELFASGKLSSQGKAYHCNAEGLKALTEEELGKAFQVSSENPLIGLKERTQLLQRLGDCAENSPEYFQHYNENRPGNLAFYLLEHSKEKKISAVRILRSVLLGFENMWPKRIEVDGKCFGDLWHYSGFGTEAKASNYIAFHKLSQWLSYSLMEGLMDFGNEVIEIDQLTGLPEYRNGGLFVDLGVLKLRDPEDYNKPWRVDSSTIIEWRAATVCLLDKLAPLLRQGLNKTPEEMPLVKLLEAGTWHAGRAAAKKFRNSSQPPLRLNSDATVF